MCRHSGQPTGSATASFVSLSPSSAAAAFDPLSNLYRRLSILLCHPPAETNAETKPAEPASRILACSASVADPSWSSDADRPNVLRRVARSLGRWARSLLDALLVAARAAEVSAVLSPLLLLTPAAVASSRIFGATRPSDVAWWYTLNSLEFLGPAFVKLAQWAATRRDLFPPQFCDRLGQLHDRARVHPWSHTHRVLTERFGNYQARGLRISPDAIVGSGSAAQVYRGTLTTRCNDGEGSSEESRSRTVAVKVLHPKIGARVERDLLLMRRVAALLDSVPLEAIKVLSLPRATETFASVLRRQVDLRVEGANLVRFGDNFSYRRRRRSRLRRKDDDGSSNAEVPSTAILFPRPVDAWIGTDVLIETFVEDARPISHYIGDDTDEKVRKVLAGNLLRAFLKMMFIDNFVHCDLHPGNVLVRTNTKEVGVDPAKSSYTIAFLDAGIAVSLSPNDRRNLRDLFRAVILNQGEEAGRLMVERARYERCSAVEGGVEAFSRGVGEIVSEFHDRRKRGLTLGTVRIGALLGRVLDLCRIHGVEINPAMSSIVVSTLVLEGLGRSLEPDLNLLDFALPFVLGRGKV